MTTPTERQGSTDVNSPNRWTRSAAALAAALSATLLLPAVAAADVTNPAKHPFPITVTIEGQTYTDGEDTLPGYDDQLCTPIPGVQYDFAIDEIQYYDGSDLVATAKWTEWSRISSYETWLKQQQGGSGPDPDPGAGGGGGGGGSTETPVSATPTPTPSSPNPASSNLGNTNKNKPSKKKSTTKQPTTKQPTKSESTSTSTSGSEQQPSSASSSNGGSKSTAAGAGAAGAATVAAGGRKAASGKASTSTSSSGDDDQSSSGAAVVTAAATATPEAAGTPEAENAALAAVVPVRNAATGTVPTSTRAAGVGILAALALGGIALLGVGFLRRRVTGGFA